MKKEKGLVKVEIGFDFEEEIVSYIKSDFMDEELGFKDPVGYTAKLLQMALETWVRDKIGIYCPECDGKLEEDWIYCPECGNSNE